MVAAIRGGPGREEREGMSSTQVDPDSGPAPAADHLDEHGPGSSTFADEDEPEPLSFAPGRLRRASLPPPGVLPPAGAALPPPSSRRASWFPPSARGDTLMPASMRGDALMAPPSVRGDTLMTPPSSRRGAWMPLASAHGDVLAPPSTRRSSWMPPSSRGEASITPPPLSVRGASVVPPPTSVRGTSMVPPPASVRGAAILPPPSSARGASIVPPPVSVRGTAILPPPSSGTSILPPPSGLPGAYEDFEVLSSRFGNPYATLLGEPDRDAAWAGLQEAVRETSGDLRRRALVALDPGEQARFIGHAESLDRLLATPLAAEYMLQPGVAAGLLAQLRKLRAAERGWPAEREYRDVLLKAAATSIHIAPCLGYWQSNEDVPYRIKRLLTNESVYGSVLEIAKTRKSKDVDGFISRYTSVVGTLAKDATLNLQVRKPIIWPWCRYAIEKVAYTFRGPGEPAEGRRIEDAFTDIKLLQVLFNVFADDAADNVQDPALVRLLAELPTAGGTFGVAPPAAYDGLRARLRAIGREAFEGYLDLAVEVWTYTVEQLRALAREAYAAHEPRLAYDYARIMDSMRLSVDLNSRPLDVFQLGPDAFERRYGGRDFGETLAHNANRMGFYTMDLVRLHAVDAARHAHLAAAGAFPAYDRLAALFQEMHQLGNSVATGAREAESDDVSNELFKIANEQLNATSGWVLPAPLASALGPDREDVLLRAFARKKEVRRRRAVAARGSAEHRAAHDEYLRLSDGIEELIEATDSQTRTFDAWLVRRFQAADLAERAELPDAAALLAGNDLLLVLHLVYKGKI